MMRYIFLIIITFASILILWINIKLHSENFNFSEQKADIILQLNFLDSELKTNNAAQRMQNIFPEGFVFINALYGLAWCELALSDTSNDKHLKEKAISEALFAYNEINSDRAKWTFNSYLTPENGIFYFGWRNYLLSKILTIDTTFNGHESYVDTFLVHCEIIKNAIENTDNPYLESYAGQSWPADMFVAMASLSNYDKIFKPEYDSIINSWLERVKTRLDPKTNMIPHSVDSKTDMPIQGARGCSMSLILRMLPEIDFNFANEQFKLLEPKFNSKIFGLPSIREYPLGQKGKGDIDSGPVIFGVGFSATIVAIGTYSFFNKDNSAENQYKTINAFGFERKNGNMKSYLSGKLPIADAFIAWGRASSLENNLKINTIDTNNWRVKFHFVSLLFILPFWILYFRKTIMKVL